MRGLPPPDAGLKACVVVPARDEAVRVAACLEALAAQEGLAPSAWEVLLVLDECSDNTAEVALEVAGRNPSLTLHLLPGPGLGSGAARGTGMDAACARLLSVNRPTALIASTDADSWVAADWLARQVDLAREGARAIGGRIQLCPVESATLPAEVLAGHAERAQTRFRRVLSECSHPEAVNDHWQFSGASMSVTAETYAKVGGLADYYHSEDEQLERALAAHAVPIHRHLDVRVTTSARFDGRAINGLADVLRDLSRR